MHRPPDIPAFRHGPALGQRLAQIIGFNAWGFGAPQNPFVPPGDLDYSQAVAGIQTGVDAAAQRDIDYKKPQPAREGYTRSPLGTDMLICQDCESELGVKTAEGEEDKSDEVWVAMKCGHVGFPLGYVPALIRRC